MEILIALILTLAITLAIAKVIATHWKPVLGTLAVLLVIGGIINRFAPEKPTQAVALASTTTPAAPVIQETDEDKRLRQVGEQAKQEQAAAIARANEAARLAAETERKRLIAANPEAERKRLEDARARRLDASEAAKLTTIKWHIGGFGSVMVVDRVVIKNEGKRPVANIVIECDLSSRSGVPISSVRFTIREVVQPGKSGTFRDLSAGFIDQQTGNASCGVRDATYIGG